MRARVTPCVLRLAAHRASCPALPMSTRAAPSPARHAGQPRRAGRAGQQDVVLLCGAHAHAERHRQRHDQLCQLGAHRSAAAFPRCKARARLTYEVGLADRERRCTQNNVPQDNVLEVLATMAAICHNAVNDPERAARCEPVCGRVPAADGRHSQRPPKCLRVAVPADSATRGP